jgi:glutamine amidotransferase
METIAVVDYGMGNLRSVVKAVEHVADGKTRVQLTSDAKAVESAHRIVFPGQGAARDCMRSLREHKLIEALSSASKNKPFLGICMGLQVLLSHSRENNGIDCLDILPGEVEYFGDSPEFAPELARGRYKIPHMGWNQVKQRPHPLWAGVPDNSRFYFVHSYYVNPRDTNFVMGTTEYGTIFTSAAGRDNLFAVQFHPEKSATYGLRLLRNFVNWNGMC